jgi:uncharacterized iron-regulated protein
MTLVATLCAILAQAPVAPESAAPAYVPERVYDTQRGAFSDFEAMLADLVRADVVFVGEQHDDPNTHRLEQAMLDGLRRRRATVTVSFEMFERDVQNVVDRYLSGAITEAQFLQEARPWPRYATDYRALVELAKKEGWAVIAANVPRRLASEVAKSGQSALDRLTPEDRALIAREFQCPQDAYFERFAKAMTGHSPGTAATADQRATTDRYYWSQCMKDETMAESIAAAVSHRGANAGPVVHFTGAFHSDFGTGTAERTRRRLEGRRVVVISVMPVTDVDTLAPAGDDLRRADFLVYTTRLRSPE